MQAWDLITGNLNSKDKSGVFVFTVTSFLSGFGISEIREHGDVAPVKHETESTAGPGEFAQS